MATTDPLNVLIVADDEHERTKLRNLLSGHKVSTSTNPEEVSRALARMKDVDVVFLDIESPGAPREELRALFPAKGSGPAVVWIVAASDDQTLAWQREGKSELGLSKPLTESKVLQVLEQVKPGRSAKPSLGEQHQAIPLSLDSLIGCSRAIEELKVTLERVAQSTSTVLIRGESGTGKGLVARILHFTSPRRAGPFQPCNCAALSETLVESELFGHEKGAFTGATERKLGRFELADGGTVFLDEIGKISKTVQAKLLRVVEDKEFERVGGTRTLRSDVRIITATNLDLEAAILRDDFHEDLYYRLNIIPIVLPPLRERRQDVPYLVKHFLERIARDLGQDPRELDPAVLDLFGRHRWPGNVRELESAIHRALVLSSAEILGPEDFAWMAAATGGAASPVPMVLSRGGSTGPTPEELDLYLLEAIRELRERAERGEEVDPYDGILRARPLLQTYLPGLRMSSGCFKFKGKPSRSNLVNSLRGLLRRRLGGLTRRNREDLAWLAGQLVLRVEAADEDWSKGVSARVKKFHGEAYLVPGVDAQPDDLAEPRPFNYPLADTFGIHEKRTNFAIQLPGIGRNAYLHRLRLYLDRSGFEVLMIDAFDMDVLAREIDDQTAVAADMPGYKEANHERRLFLWMRKFKRNALVLCAFNGSQGERPSESWESQWDAYLDFLRRCRHKGTTLILVQAAVYLHAVPYGSHLEVPCLHGDEPRPISDLNEAAWKQVLRELRPCCHTALLRLFEQAPGIALRFEPWETGTLCLGELARAGLVHPGGDGSEEGNRAHGFWPSKGTGVLRRLLLSESRSPDE